MPTRVVVALTHTEAGVLIGRGGSTVSRLRSETGAGVRVSPAASASADRFACITGSLGQVVQALRAVTALIAADSRRQTITLTIVASDKTVGCLIGRGGHRLRDLRKRSPCTISISDRGGDRLVSLTGTPLQIHAVSREVIDLLQAGSSSSSSSMAASDIMNVEVPKVPKIRPSTLNQITAIVLVLTTEEHSILMDPRFNHIGRISIDSGAEITLLPGLEAGQDLVWLKGKSTQIFVAWVLILDLVRPTTNTTLALALLAAAERQIFARRHKVDFGHDICLVTPIFPPSPSSSIRGTATVPVSLNTVGFTGLVLAHGDYDLQLLNPVSLQPLWSASLQCGTGYLDNTTCLPGPITALHIDDYGACGVIGIVSGGGRVVSFRVFANRGAVNVARWRRISNDMTPDALGFVCLDQHRQHVLIAHGRRLTSLYLNGNIHWSGTIPASAVRVSQKSRGIASVVLKSGLVTFNTRARELTSNVCAFAVRSEGSVNQWPSELEVTSSRVVRDTLFVAFSDHSYRIFNLTNTAKQNVCELVEADSQPSVTGSVTEIVSADPTVPVRAITKNGATHLYLGDAKGPQLSEEPISLHAVKTAHSDRTWTLVVVFSTSLESYYFHFATSHQATTASFLDNFSFRPPVLLLAGLVFFFAKHYRSQKRGQEEQRAVAATDMLSDGLLSDPFLISSRRKARREARRYVESPAELNDTAEAVDAIADGLQKICEEFGVLRDEGDTSEKKMFHE